MVSLSFCFTALLVVTHRDIGNNRRAFEVESFMFDWFLNLHSKVKLFVLSSSLLAMLIIVAAIGYYSVLQSINAANDISVVLNRSSARVNAVQQTLRSFDNNNITFLAASVGSDESTDNYRTRISSILSQLKQAVDTMNPKLIGNLPSNPAYEAAILQIKNDMQEVDTLFRGQFMGKIETSRYEALVFYIDDVRPHVTQMYQNLYKLVATQNALVIKLAQSGSDMTYAYIAIAVALAAVVLGIIMSWTICSYITNCIKRQEHFMAMIREGNFNFDLGKYYKDDFGSIIESIGAMRDNMNHALTLVKINSEKTEASLDRIVALAHETADKVSDCEGRSISVSAASEEMLSTTQDIAKNCDDASKLANETNDIINAGVASIKSSIDDIRKQSEEVHANSVAVEKVAKRSMDINSIVSTIEDIADQTNLLALNAAIEAARAGEAGRGFAVVADEVRALASRTASSTKEIAEMVSDIQKDAAAAATSINNSVASMELTTQNTAEVESHMHEMLEHVDAVNTQISQIASAAEEQSTATNEISQHIHGITNLTQDHLDFHPDMLSYFKAKARLFLEVPRDDKAMSINADDEWGRRLLELCPSALSYGLHEGLPGQRHLRGELLSAGTDGCRLRMTLGRESWELHSPLVGAFNASNLLAVQALALELGLKPDQLAVLAGFMGVCGRLERVPNPQGLHVFVDYAHTPDALINVLKALRGAGFRRIVAVFGCGGNRDRTKRPLMGQAVARYADVAVLTSDNPRFEDPEAILRDVLPGLADARETVVEVDRRTATARALELLGPDDALLIAGKGHEDYQIIQGVKHHYSDQEVVRELLGCA